MVLVGNKPGSDLAGDTDHFPATIGPIAIPAGGAKKMKCENERRKALHRLDRRNRV
jgi:hypothetical protein